MKSPGVNLFLARSGELYRLKASWGSALVALDENLIDELGTDCKIWITPDDILMFLELLPEVEDKSVHRRFQAKFLFKEKIVFAGWAHKEDISCVTSLEKIELPKTRRRKR